MTNKSIITYLKDRFKGELIIADPKPYDFKVHISMCIHRVIQGSAVNSMYGLLSSPNPKIVCSSHMGDGLIDRARSMEASDYLRKSDADVFMFLDDDISYDPIEVVDFLKRMYKDNLDIAGATYIVKTDKNPFITAKPFPGQVIRFADGSPMVEVRTLGTGFMAMRKWVLSTMAQTLPLCHPKTLSFYPFFQPYPAKLEEDGDWLYLSEDWAFCNRARDLGFKIWLDPSVRLKHTGSYTYELDDLSRPEKQHFQVINYSDPN